MKTWSKTKNGLRFHFPSKRYYINAKRPGAARPTSLCTGTNVESEAKSFYARWLAEAHAPESAAKVIEGLTLAPYVAAEELKQSLEESSAHTARRKCSELKYLKIRWANFYSWGELTADDARRARLPATLSDVDPRKLTALDLLSFQKFLGGKYQAAVANRLLRLLSLVLSRVEEDVKGFVSPHRSRDFRPLRVPPREKIALPTAEQLRQVIATVRADVRNPLREQTADMVEALTCSLRWEECRMLRVEHVDLQNSCLRLPAGIVKGKRHARTIPLAPQSVELFRRLVTQARADGRLFHTFRANDALERACAVVGCMKLTHHTLRHWWATMALEQTGDVKQVAEWLGHQDGGKLVAETYTHTRQERERILAAKLTADWMTPKT